MNEQRGVKGKRGKWGEGARFTSGRKVPCGRQTKDLVATAGDANEAIQLQMQIHK